MLRILALYCVALAGLLAGQGDLQAASKAVSTSPPAAKPASQFVIGTNNLGSKLLLELSKNKKDSNLVISPTSISLALSMLMNGADGKTLDEIAAVLGTDAKGLASWNQAASDFLDDSIQSDVELEMANALFAQQGCGIQSAFAKTVQKTYHGRTRELDFLKDSQGSVDAINDWVKRNTAGKIDKLFDKLDPDTQAVLANGVYLNAPWQVKFRKHMTADRDFTNSKGDRKPLPTMHSQDTLEYLAAPNFQAVNLPYNGGRYGMWVMLPKTGTAVGDLVKSLDHATLERYAQQFKPTYGVLYLPKVRTKFDEILNKNLQALGMTQAFDKQKADLSKIFDPATAKYSKFAVDKVVHKTFVNIDEDGTEAAAVTGIAIVGVASIPPQPAFTMDVNRPFLFLIRDKDTGAVIFIATIADPSK